MIRLYVNEVNPTKKIIFWKDRIEKDIFELKIRNNNPKFITNFQNYLFSESHFKLEFSLTCLEGFFANIRFEV